MDVSIGFLAATGVVSIVAFTFIYRWLLRIMYGKL
jgi:hypothetical protein